MVGENNDKMQPGGSGFRLFFTGHPHIGKRRESRRFDRRWIHRHSARHSIFDVSIHFQGARKHLVQVNLVAVRLVGENSEPEAAWAAQWWLRDFN